MLGLELSGAIDDVESEGNGPGDRGQEDAPDQADQSCDQAVHTSTSEDRPA